MFSQFCSIKNGAFENVPNEIIEKVTKYLHQKDKSNLAQLNKFFNQFTKENELRKEQKLFATYSLMVKYVKHDNIPCVRCDLEKDLFNSKDIFLHKAKIALSNQQIAVENINHKKKFSSLILYSDASEITLNNMQESLYSFLYSLCFIQAINALDIFINKYQNAIKELTIEEFNSLCTAAATNHLFGFMIYLCKQSKSIDEYTEVSDTVGIIFGAKLTPLIAACLSAAELPSPARVYKAKKVIELLLENNADINKQYICDDLSYEEMTEILNQGKGYSIIDNFAEGINAYENNTHAYQTKTNVNLKPTIDFMRYVLSLKPTIIEKHNTMRMT